MTVALGPIIVEVLGVISAKCTYCENTCRYLKGDTCTDRERKLTDPDITPDWCAFKVNNIEDALDK